MVSEQNSSIENLDHLKMVRLNTPEMWLLASTMHALLEDTENMKDLREAFTKISEPRYILKTEDIQDYFSLFATLIEIPLDAIEHFERDVIKNGPCTTEEEKTASTALSMGFDSILRLREDLLGKEKLHVCVKDNELLLAF